MPFPGSKHSQCCLGFCLKRRVKNSCPCIVEIRTLVYASKRRRRRTVLLAACVGILDLLCLQPRGEKEANFPDHEFLTAPPTLPLSSLKISPQEKETHDKDEKWNRMKGGGRSIYIIIMRPPPRIIFLPTPNLNPFSLPFNLGRSV